MYHHCEITVLFFSFQSYSSRCEYLATFLKWVGKYHGEIRRGEKREKRTSDETVDQLLTLTRRREEEEEAEEESMKGMTWRAGEEEQKGGSAWTAGQTAPVDNLFFLRFIATPAPFPFSSPFLPGALFFPWLCPTSLLGFALVAFRRLASNRWFEFCPSNIGSNNFADDTQQIILKMTILLLEKDVEYVYEIVYESFYRC